MLRDSVESARSRDYAVFAVWWLAWVVRWFAFFSSRGFSHIHGGIVLLVVACVAEIVAALALIYLVRRISAGQLLRERELDAYLISAS